MKAKKFKAVPLAILALIIVLIAASCSKSASQDPGKGTPSSSPSGTQSATASADDKTPITLTMFGADPNPNWENMESPVGKKITEITGVKLQMEYAIGDQKQKISLMAASGEYPDLIFAHGNENILVDAGAYLDLTDLIEKYGPNIKKLYGDYLSRLRWNGQDKSIYYLGSFGVNDKQWKPATGFELQHAVVKDLGYPKLKTLQDFENAIKTYKDKHPTIDGQPTIGLSLLADDWRYKITVTNPAVFSTGGPDDGEWWVDPETHKAKFHYTRPEEKEYFKWLNHMNAVGLLDKESFVQKYDQYNAKISSGRVIALADANWEYVDAERALRQAGKDDRMYGMYPITLREDIKYADFQSAGYSAGWGVGISKTAKDPVRAIKFLDWLASDEAQILNYWGIEGVHYKIENGKRVIPPEEMAKRVSDPEYGKKTGIGVFTYPFPQQGIGVLDPSGQTYTTDSLEQIKANYTAAEKDVLSHYGVEMWKDLYPPTESFPVKPWGAAWQINIPQNTDAAVIAQKCEDIVKKKVPQMILAKPGEFDRIWDEFMADLDKAGVHKMEDEFSKLLADKIKLWNE
ncbi:MAG: polysaccharide transporter substrate-binding protein [Cohnella sp.]|jgi:putative aldouronate transport system substrate-binding protein|nr:polysaccharide transporter substrate-binding protein [Cohnella sp.]